MLPIDIVKAVYNNNVEKLIALSSSPSFKTVVNTSYTSNKKVYPIWTMKKDNTYFNKDILGILVENDASLDCVNEHGQTLLMYCIEREYTNAAKALIEYDCNINIQDTAGMTALHYSVYNLDVELTSLLLMCDIDKECKDNCGQTAHDYIINDIRHQHIDNITIKKEKCKLLFL